MSGGHLYVYLGTLLIFHWVMSLVLSCLSSSCILDINLLPDISFVNTFFQSIGCLIVLVIASFAVQSLFSLM